MKKLCGATFFSLIVSSTASAGFFTGFTKGNSCAQYCIKEYNCENYCKGDKVFGTTMVPLATYDDLVIVELTDKGIKVKSKSKKIEGFMDYGTFKLSK